jgi:hypothetical protein
MKSSVLDLGNLIQGFRLSCQIEGKSPKTTEWYTSFLEQFRGFLEQSGLPMRVDRVDKNCVRRFILYLKQEVRTPRTGRPLSAATVQGYVRTLKAFFAWLAHEEYITANLMAKIPVPKAEAKIVATFSEVQGLLGLCMASNGSRMRNTVAGRALDEWAYRKGVKLNFIRPGKPIENALAESFIGRLRDECLNTNWFMNLKHARDIIEEWRRDYNEVRPHSSLKGSTPKEYAEITAGL